MGIEGLAQRDKALALETISTRSMDKYRDMAAQRMGFETWKDMAMLPAEHRLAMLKQAREAATFNKDLLATDKIDWEIRKIEAELRGGVAKDAMERQWIRLSVGGKLPKDVAKRMGVEGTSYADFVKWWRESGGVHLDLGEYTARREASERVKSRAYYGSPELEEDILKSWEDMDLFGLSEEEREEKLFDEVDRKIMGYTDAVGKVRRFKRDGVFGWEDDKGVIRIWRRE